MRTFKLVLGGLTTSLLVASLSCGGTQSARSGLSVAATPTGEVGTSDLKLVFEFSQPMVEATAIGKAVTPPIEFTPSIKGEAIWRDERTVVFTASEKLPASTRFVAQVPRQLRSITGDALGGEHLFEFSTERLWAEIEVDGSDDHATLDQEIDLRFNYTVSFEQLQSNCRYERTVDDKLHTELVRLSDPEAKRVSSSFSLRPVRALPMETDWDFTCNLSLRATVGNLGLASAETVSFRTHGPLTFDGMDPEGDEVVPSEGKRLDFAFSNPLKPPYKLSIEPAIAKVPERCYPTGEPGIGCQAMLEPRTRYTITIDASQEDIFGQTLGKNVVLQMTTVDAEPAISMESGYFVAELKRPSLPLWSRNVKAIEVAALAVTPANFHQVQSRLNWWDADPADFSEAKLVMTRKTLDVAGTLNEWAQHPVDPVEIFGGAPGPGMYYVEVGTKDVDSEPFDGGVKKVLVNFTDIGVVSKISPSRGLVWATSLKTGAPLPGARVEVRNDEGVVTWSGRTDRTGVAMLPPIAKLLGKKPEENADDGDGDDDDDDDEGDDEDWEGDEGDWEEEQGSLNIFVSAGKDWTMVNARREGGLSLWNFSVAKDSSGAPVRLRGFMHTDRGLYRPGEKVYIKGIARESALGKALAVPTDGKVNVEIEDPRGRTFMETEARLSRFGGFWLDLDLPGDARLGDYTVRARLKNGSFKSRFQVEEFQPATFELSGSSSVKQMVRQGRVTASILAKYLYGAPLRDGEVELTVYQRPRRVSFPQHEGFAFVDERREGRYHHSSQDSQELVTEDTVSLTDTGTASIDVDIAVDDIASDADLLVRASVTAPSNEVINKTFTIPYFRSRRYFGIKSPGYFIDVGEPQKLQVMSVSPSGEPSAGPAKLQIKRNQWNCVWEDWGYRGSYQCKKNSDVVLEKNVMLRADAPLDVAFTPDTGGDYTVIIEGTDGEKAAPASRELYAWGDGGGSYRSEDSMTFDIVSDKTEYRAGDTATLVLKTDLAKATGLLTIERDGIVEKRLIEISGKKKHIKVPIARDAAPNVYVSVALVSGRLGEGRRGKPRMRMGLINLPVRPEGNTLNVKVETLKPDYRPGEKVTARVVVTDASGRGVPAELALTAADEGVLSLIGYRTPNPVPTFYAPWGIGVTTATQLAYIKDLPSPKMQRPASGGDGAAPGSVRSRFMSTAVWKPGVVTNGAGVAMVTFDAPDNLTAFRVMAVAADRATRFGSGEKRFTVSKPLQLHRTLPRFVTIGDRVDGGVVVHNETGKAGTAVVTLTLPTSLKAAGELIRKVEVPVGGRVPVRYKLEAVDVGEAAMTFSVEMNGERDAIELKLPINHPSPIRRDHVAHGAMSGEKVINVSLPANAVASSTEVHVSVDPDGLSGIEDGLRDLIGYPYGCLEQTTSKVIPMIAVRGLTETLDIKGLSGSKLNRFVVAGVAKIGRHQTSSGGFSLWPGGHAEAFYTAYALWGLHLAREAGYTVDQSRIDDGIRYLKNDGKRPDTSTPYYHEAGDLGSQAFALYVRSMLGDKDTAAATALAARTGVMPLYGKAFLARALAAGLGPKDPAVTRLVDDLTAAARSAIGRKALIVEPEARHLNYYMSGGMRTTAIVLDALVALDAQNASIKPLVRLLMSKRREAGHLNTQENLYSLLALTSYASSVSAVAPTVTASLGDKTIMSGALRGKDRLRVASAVLPASASVLRITSSGEVHYNIELRYRQTPATLVAESKTLSLKREYLDTDGKPKRVFKVGDIVVVKLTMPLGDAVNHLMVSDRLPGGFEPLNTNLATVGPVGGGSTQRPHYGGSMEMRDDRVDFSSEYNWGGEYVREYSVRAIASGRFALPPSVAELMYEPDKHARTALTTIEILPR